MSELYKGHENVPDNIDTSVEVQKNLERLSEKAEQAENDPIQNHIESLAKRAELQAVSGKEANVGDTHKEDRQPDFSSAKHLKADAYKRSLKKVRNNLNLPERTFSRIVHQRTVESVSNAASKTVARPSAFLGGSLGALLGSAALLYISRQNGFTYNYAIFLFLFVGGFIAGAAVELLLKLLLRHKSKY